MPIGVFANCSAVFVGGVIGALLKNRMPDYLKERMPLYFGVSCMGIGISLIVNMETLAAVVLSLILGGLIGEITHIEDLLQRFAAFAESKLSRKKTVECLGNSDIEGGTAVEVGTPAEGGKPNNDTLIVASVLFCASATGIFGSLTEGMTGDPSVLFSKAFLDLFTAAIFASTAGIAIAFLAVPQVLIMLSIFFMADFILPLATPQMIADFCACGGFIMLATGLRVAKVKQIPIANLIPALILAMPLSALWNALM